MHTFVAVGFILVTLAAAKVQVPPDVAGFYGDLREQEPKPCCAPSYFTFKSTHFLTYSLGEAGLIVEMQQATGAYDRIAEKIASRIHLGFFNGTEESYHTIDDYHSGVSYSITRIGGELICRSNELEGEFPEDCIPDDATYVGSSSLGDRAVEVDSWYMSKTHPGQDVHRVRTVQKEECVPIYSTGRYVSPDTGATFQTESSHVTDFHLGICDEDKLFHVPAICFERATDNSKTPKRLRKIVRLSPTMSYIGL
ncbi:uncharacterized protein LOC110973696 [Acanthaster planci]|uniref:Uncharacterized protein LOC110973696 n=1 Tax=Acanthaster planci TaxID=133434 RepID=A0A8B7XHX0_ACAPL|nr:uncharacterized protein LOC110973696 [Acanthaster planci]